MDKEIIRVGKLTDATERAKAPLSTVVKGGGLVFVSGMPPIDSCLLYTSPSPRD